ncbi:MAG: hypothetical protein NZ585_11515 [Chloracidobacterium sp.]|nr:hypothetical protein [Chloracidobacterium sp.]MDW8218121.1 hypothetical protein [Acidobacteriota bacterium]
MPDPTPNQLEAPAASEVAVVKFTSGDFSFVHPADWQATPVAGFQYGVRGPNGMTALFRSVSVRSSPTPEEETLAVALQDLLEHLPPVVHGDKFTTGFYTGLTAQLEVVWRENPCLLWVVVISQTGAPSSATSHGVLIIAVPTAEVEAAEQDARLILDSFAVGGQSVTDARISMSRVEAVSFDPSAYIETRRLNDSETDVSTLEDLPSHTPERKASPDWRITVSTLTASEGGYADGPLTVAKFLRPNGITCDPQGNLYVADFGGHRVRQILVDGLVRTLAGSGRAGHRDDLGLLAEFNGPRGITYAAGYLYIADLNNACIRRMTLDGMVTTLAGDGVEGTRDGVGRQARFKSPRAVAVDALGTVYVADEARVRCITPDGMVTTLAGSEPGYMDGPAAVARFDTLSGLALDRVGNLYLADAGNRRLRKLSRDGQVTTLPVGPENQQDVPILHPVALCIGPDGTLYVLDAADFSLKAVLPGGAVVRIAGGQQGSQDGDAATAQFWMPTALTFFENRLYVTDRERHAIRLVRLQSLDEAETTPNLPEELPVRSPRPPSPEDQRQTKPSMTPVLHASALSSPRRIAPFAAQVGLGTADIADLVVEVVAGGEVGLRDGFGVAAQLNHPVGLAMDADGTLFIADHFNHAIRMLTPGGEVRTLAGGRQRGFRDGRGAEAEFNGPLGIAVGAQGQIYVADHLNARVRVVTRDGEVRTLAGTGIARIEDGPLVTAAFEGPKGVAADLHGGVYVTDGVTVRLITPDGYVRTLAGRERGFRDGVGERAMFGWVYAIALDVSGLCFVTDAANHAVRCVFPDGTVKTVFGGGEMRHLNFPNGLALDVYGNLYVADTNHHRVLRLTPDGNGGYTSSLICGRGRGRQVGRAQETELDAPRGIVVGFQHDLYIADSNANRILRVFPVGQSVRGMAAPSAGVPGMEPHHQGLAQALGEAETASGEQLPADSLHESSSTPVEVSRFAEQMERFTEQPLTPLPLPSHRRLEPASSVAPQVASVAASQARPRHVAATVLGWGVEVSGNTLIRTEPDGSLLLDTTYSAENSAFFYLPWNVTAEQKVVVEIKMQLVAYVGERDATGCAVWFENDRYADALLIQPDGIRLLRTPDLAYACNPCAGINTYTVMLQGGDIRIAFNGVECIVGLGRFWVRPAARDGRPPRRWLAFGDGSATAGSISRWQSVTYYVVDEETLPLVTEG